MEGTNCDIPDAMFAASGIYRLGLSFPDRTTQASTSIDQGTYRRCMGQLFEYDTYVRLMKPFDGVRDELIELAHHFDDIVLVVSAHGATPDALEAVVAKYDLPITEVVSTYGADKVLYYQMADVIIDNEARHLAGLRSPEREPILVRLPEGATGWEFERTHGDPRGDFFVANDLTSAAHHARQAIMAIAA